MFIYMCICVCVCVDSESRQCCIESELSLNNPGGSWLSDLKAQQGLMRASFLICELT